VPALIPQETVSVVQSHNQCRLHDVSLPSMIRG
jgi:hypothetical protein